MIGRCESIVASLDLMEFFWLFTLVTVMSNVHPSINPSIHTNIYVYIYIFINKFIHSFFIQWEYHHPFNTPSQASHSSDISGRFSGGCAGTVPGAKPLFFSVETKPIDQVTSKKLQKRQNTGSILRWNPFFLEGQVFRVGFSERSD